MSGICAVWQKNDPHGVAETTSSITMGLSLEPEDRLRYETGHGAGVGVAARFGTQQIYRNSRILLACDADLYNREELSKFVENQGQVPANEQTASLITALYERFGCDFAEKLRGSFSVVLWDSRERQLVAAIDGFGINRLVYYEDSAVLLVATRIGALAQSGRIDLEVNPRTIANVLNFTANLAPDTVFTKVQRLIPAGLLVASGKQTRITKYWDMRYGLGDGTNEDRLCEELESLVERSVAAQCKAGHSDKVGAFLSGGTDSSTVVGMMSRTERSPVEAFSIGFQEQPFNELGYAKIAADRFNAQHHTYLVGADDCFEALPRMVRYFDEPFGNASAIPTYFCARLAAQNGVNVLLGGDGGDELFAGNEWYRTDKIFAPYQAVPQALRTGVIEPFLARLPVQGGVIGKARRYIRRANMPGAERVLSFQFLSTHPLREVFEADFIAALAGYSIFEIPSRHYDQAQAANALDRLLYMDVKITLADNDLPKVTCMAELAGVRARFPFLDRAVAEFSGRVPARLKVKGLQKKYLFKRAFSKLLPAEIIKKKKHGFGIPVSDWLKTDPRLRELSHDLLLSPRAFQRGYFRREFIEDLFRRQDAEDSTYYGDTLWTFLALELWHRQNVDQPVGIAV